ncbi:MAG: hypothetical protein IPH45_21040 [Bacteroidales bacterium]|nr:hypothetical protein [Bacteroidales bacterium]
MLRFPIFPLDRQLSLPTSSIIHFSPHKVFVESIGLIVEDWETNTFTKFPWTLNGDANWVLMMQISSKAAIPLIPGQSITTRPVTYIGL